MPRGDRTGPLGYGPMTGRRMGICAGNDMAGFANSAGYGLGGGRGMARRRGCGGWNFPAGYAGAAPAQSSDSMKAHIDELEQSLAALKKKLEVMEKGGPE